MGELARLYNNAFGIGCELEVVACEGWRRAQYFDETGLPWVLPSPNMPTVDTAIVYPGMCLLEGTNLSEGRGTTRPFEIFGAPFVDGRTLAARLRARRLPGVIFRPLYFTPTFHKFAGESCGACRSMSPTAGRFCPIAPAWRSSLRCGTCTGAILPGDRTFTSFVTTCPRSIC